MNDNEQRFIVPKYRVGEVLEKIHQSGISVRMEWLPDSGFAWSVVKGDGDQQPRITVANQATEAVDTVKENGAPAPNLGAAKEPELAQTSTRRGSDLDIETAVGALGAAACELYADCEFADWFHANFPPSTAEEI